MRRFAIASMIMLSPSIAHAQGDAGPDEDEVCILEPADGAMLGGAPAMVEVVVDTANGSNLVVQDVVLRVDGVEVEGQGCTGAGICMFEVELDAGEHHLRAYASRNLGPELTSNMVTVSVVEGAASSESGGGSGGSTSGGSTSAGTSAGTSDSDGASEASESSESSDHGTVGDGDGDDGCGCTTTQSRSNVALPMIVVLAAASRRRRRRA